MLRVFSCVPERQAPAEEQQAFLDSLANSNIPSQIGDVKTEDVPGTEALLNPGNGVSTQTETFSDSNGFQTHFTSRLCYQ